MLSMFYKLVTSHNCSMANVMHASIYNVNSFVMVWCLIIKFVLSNRRMPRRGKSKKG